MFSGKVAAREASYNNASTVARNPLLSSIKLVYYKIFAKMYSVMGARSKLVFVNSSWTKGHVDAIWEVPDRTTLLYPPCNTEKFLEISGPRSNRIVSVAQFRPEKDHRLQIESFAKFVEKTGRRDVKLTLVGGVRNQGDKDRVNSLIQLSETLQIEDLVEFKVSIPYSELHQILSDSLIGLHTMWNEHFGIGVVEFLAAGIIPVAHNSGGPKLDIVVPGSGFLASTSEQYSDHMIRVFEMSPEELEEMRNRGREHVTGTFSDETFRTVFIEKCVDELGMDLRWIEELGGDSEDLDRLEEYD
jgi:alpha-1,2-mannosyltransferase